MTITFQVMHGALYEASIVLPILGYRIWKVKERAGQIVCVGGGGGGWGVEVWELGCRTINSLEEKGALTVENTHWMY